MFTDRPDKICLPWRAVYVDPSSFGFRRTGRYLKCLSHIIFPDARVSVYFDASFLMLRSLDDILSDHEDTNFALFRHPQRDDIETEAVACKRALKDDNTTIDAQVFRYRSKGLPTPSSCYATGVLVRNHKNESVRRVNMAWCFEIYTGSVRDQISLPYVLWSENLTPDEIKGNIYYNRYLVPGSHAGDSWWARLRRQAGILVFRLFGSRTEK
ncbi:glycosyltransferase domain-containing protein [Aurantimonas aggregata]